MQLKTNHVSIIKSQQNPVTSQMSPICEVAYETRKMAKDGNQGGHTEDVQQKFSHLRNYSVF
jgi:hypothetical protein